MLIEVINVQTENMNYIEGLIEVITISHPFNYADIQFSLVVFILTEDAP